MPWRPPPLLAVAGLILAIATSIGAQQPPRTAPPLPAVSMTCVHHPDIVETRPGTCPLCRMALVPVRLDSAWMCPVHSVVQEDKAGSCRLCRRDLVRVTVALTWTCRGDAATEYIEPGSCADGTPRMARRALRPHGNHNPQHGGQFFMAPDNWHHLEGTYPRDRTFRLYVYDDYARALDARRLAAVSARVVTRETFDPVTRRTTELRSFPLRPSRDGTYLEARVDAVSLPTEMSAKLRLTRDAPEYRFDFTFTAVTRDPNARAAPAAVVPAAPTRSAPGPARPVVPVVADPPAPVADAALAELPAATTAAERLAQLQVRRGQIETLIGRGDFGAVWVPAFAAKDLAVALEESVESLSPAQQPAGAAALRDVVRTAWLLDSVGDLGNRQNVEQAYAAFAAAVAQAVEAFK